jgi:hypothetical protein
VIDRRSDEVVIIMDYGNFLLLVKLTEEHSLMLSNVQRVIISAHSGANEQWWISTRKRTFFGNVW